MYPFNVYQIQHFANISALYCFFIDSFWPCKMRNRQWRVLVRDQTRINFLSLLSSVMFTSYNIYGFLCFIICLFTYFLYTHKIFTNLLLFRTLRCLAANVHVASEGMVINVKVIVFTVSCKLRVCLTLFSVFCFQSCVFRNDNKNCF